MNYRIRNFVQKHSDHPLLCNEHISQQYLHRKQGKLSIRAEKCQQASLDDEGSISGDVDQCSSAKGPFVTNFLITQTMSKKNGFNRTDIGNVSSKSGREFAHPSLCMPKVPV